MAKEVKKGPVEGGKTDGRAHKIVNGTKVFPVLYVGKYNGHGKYIAAAIDSLSINKELILDSTGKPIPYKFL
jgi:hypothetical protein